MDPEKRKKLEEIKRRKRMYQEQIKQDEARRANSKKSVDEEAKEILKHLSKTKNKVESDELLNKTQNNIYKLIQSQRLQELSESNFREVFPAYKPELYDEGTQWYDQNKEEEEEESDNDDKEQIQNKPKEPLVVKKNKQITNINNTKEDKIYNVLPEEEAEKEINNHKDEINDFLRTKKRYMERAINEDDLYNMFLNDDQEYQTSLPDSDLIHPLMEFYDKSTEKRTISALEWSLKYPELLLSCYTKRSDDFVYSQQNGLIHIWNLANKKEPEFTFRNQAEITSAIFHPYNPKLIIGGTETGVVVVWDTRGKQAPIYKTPLGVGSSTGSKSHTGDITCLGVIGSMNSCHIISLSNGIICSWSLNNMTTPVKKI